MKAAKACLEGFPTIGLGGVWNFRGDAERGEENDRLLPELAKIAWTGRRVDIVFDSDAADKADVREALRRLANLLIGAGAAVFKVMLPNGGDKVGLDDLLITKRGPATLKRLLAAAEPLSLTPWDSPSEDWAMQPTADFRGSTASHLGKRPDGAPSRARARRARCL